MIRQVLIALLLALTPGLVHASTLTEHVTLTNDQQVVLYLNAVDRFDAPAEFPANGPPAVWTSDTPGTLKLTPGLNGQICTLEPQGPVGDLTVTVAATVGGVTMKDTIKVTVVAGKPAAIAISADAPEGRP